MNALVCSPTKAPCVRAIISGEGDSAVEVVPSLRVAPMRDAILNTHGPLPNARRGRNYRH